MSRAEEFIQNYTRNCSNEIIGGGWVNGEFVHIFNPWLTPDQARKAVEIAMEEIYEWLSNNSEKYVYWMDEEFGKEDLITDLKQAMKDEQDRESRAESIGGLSCIDVL